MAGFPVAAGHPSYRSSGSGQLIPIKFSSKLVPKFYNKSVIADISSTEYQGEITKDGDKIIIRTMPDITIREYVKGQELISEKPSSAEVEMYIDKGHYYDFEGDDIDVKQWDMDWMSKWSEDAANQFKVYIDRAVLAGAVLSAGTTVKGATAGKVSSSYNLGATTAALAIDKTNILDFIVACGVVADEENWPDENRKLVLPAWAIGYLKSSDIKDASLTGDSTSTLRNGRVGVVDRFTIYSSNQLPLASVTQTATGLAANEYSVPFCLPSALAFAAQLTKVESVRSERSFSTHNRGLMVYGYKVIKPEAFGLAIIRKG